MIQGMNAEFGCENFPESAQCEDKERDERG
jgi:hypothetical protein